MFNPVPEVRRYTAIFLRKLPQTISVYCTFMEEFINNYLTIK